MNLATDEKVNHLTIGRLLWCLLPNALTFVVVILSTVLCRGEEAMWAKPAIDTWSYVNSFSGGSRLQAPSFGGISLDSETNRFFENDLQGPARLGSFLMAFETDNTVDAGLDPSRYAINSATVTVRSQSGSVGEMPYTDQPITPDSLLAEALGGGMGSQQPFELFGVGFRDGYEGFALGPDQSGDRFAESTAVYSAGDGGYVAYPVVGDSQGGYADVSNNFTGGFSATTADNQTEPFEATPWSIGTTALNIGEAIPNDTTFTFDIDLALPGVVDYLQQSLAEGAVGFYLSSIHPAAQPGGAGGGSYPQWYAKEAVGIFGNAEAPTFALDFTILPLAGDYDNNGSVDELDYDAWQTAYGTTVSPVGSGADGNGDGVVNAADYTLWRDAQGTSTVGARTVPEPSAGVYALAAILTASFCFGQIAYTSPRGPRK